MNVIHKANNLLKILGPGLLYAGAAIGVSHLVQSTRAGAQFGNGLIWAVILANVLKYPFFEIGPRYAAITGKSLLFGYKQEHKSLLLLFVLMTLSTMFIIQAAVTVVTAGLAAFIFGVSLPPWIMSGILLIICGAILAVGKYTLLDKTMKVIVIVLSITTVAALIASFGAPISRDSSIMETFQFSEDSHLIFLIALIGWMPAPLDVSVWHSVWSVEQFKLNGSSNLKESLLDFKIGYWGTAIMALFFLGLGANMIYGTSLVLDPRGEVFAEQLIGIYTSSLGQWAYYIIAIAAFTTMFSTTLTCLDAFPRVLSPSIPLLKDEELDEAKTNRHYWICLFVTIIGSVTLLALFLTNMKSFVDFATTISFMTAPIFAIMNLKAIFGKEIPIEHQPSNLLKYLSYLGVVFLTGFSLYYLLSLKLHLF